jgi:hypothetical protein
MSENFIILKTVEYDRNLKTFVIWKVEIFCKIEKLTFRSCKGFDLVHEYEPVTVAERSKACTVFVRSEAGTLGSNPTQGMDVWCVCVCVCVCVCMSVFVCSGREALRQADHPSKESCRL